MLLHFLILAKIPKIKILEYLPAQFDSRVKNYFKLFSVAV
jgi:hypothetical protein